MKKYRRPERNIYLLFLQPFKNALVNTDLTVKLRFDVSSLRCLKSLKRRSQQVSTINKKIGKLLSNPEISTSVLIWKGNAQHRRKLKVDFVSARRIKSSRIPLIVSFFNCSRGCWASYKPYLLGNLKNKVILNLICEILLLDFFNLIHIVSKLAAYYMRPFFVKSNTDSLKKKRIFFPN